MNPDSISFVNACKNYCNTHFMINPGDTVIVGLSGGADSVCLLYTLNELKCELNIKLKAVHVNHGIRGEEALRDELFSERLCEKLGVELKVFKFNCPQVAEATGEGLEECGRRLRYEAFSSVCENNFNFKIATAHNANDNAETILFNLARGTALKGASGIPPVRDNIIRPLLFASREDIEHFCKSNSLEFVTDSTNLSDDYTRNKIRHRVLTELTEINPLCIEAFSRFSDSVSDVTDFIEEQAKEAIASAKKGSETYSSSKLSELHPAVLKEAVHLLVSGFCGVAPSYSRVLEITGIIKSGGKLQLYGDYFMCADKENVIFYKKIETRELPELPAIPVKVVPFSEKYGEFHVEIKKYTNNSKKINRLVLDNLIDCDKIVGIPILRTRENGDTFTLPRRNVTKSLKKLFNEARIPPCDRSSVPLLSDDLGVIWIYGFGTAARCKPTAESENLYIAEGERK